MWAPRDMKTFSLGYGRVSKTATEYNNCDLQSELLPRLVRYHSKKCHSIPFWNGLHNSKMSQGFPFTFLLFLLRNTLHPSHFSNLVFLRGICVEGRGFGLSRNHQILAGVCTDGAVVRLPGWWSYNNLRKIALEIAHRCSFFRRNNSCTVKRGQSVVDWYSQCKNQRVFIIVASGGRLKHHNNGNTKGLTKGNWGLYFKVIIDICKLRSSIRNGSQWGFFKISLEKEAFVQDNPAIHLKSKNWTILKITVHIPWTTVNYWNSL